MKYLTPDERKLHRHAIDGTAPGARHSHCLTYWQGQVILTGGLNHNHEPTDQVFGLVLSSMTWEKWDLDGPLYARYSHTAHLHDNMLLLVGGVNTEEKPPGLAVISLISHTALEFSFPTQDKQSLLMLHRHTSVMRQNVGKATPQLVLLGGGGNCFSFGTHLNRTPVLVDVEAACASLQRALKTGIKGIANRLDQDLEGHRSTVISMEQFCETSSRRSVHTMISDTGMPTDVLS
ncbi:hypothetical protein RRG08_045870 [Elysia crispata]|uniref:Uncharacterized protein n=1 Tax=Elysia crispata TaxID=231223 RepID=A0AAE0ZEV4_9GAST|nr:hypothetical protein RRG08_045870 [Elysia crispata]